MALLKPNCRATFVLTSCERENLGACMVVDASLSLAIVVGIAAAHTHTHGKIVVLCRAERVARSNHHHCQLMQCKLNVEMRSVATQ